LNKLKQALAILGILFWVNTYVNQNKESAKIMGVLFDKQEYKQTGILQLYMCDIANHIRMSASQTANIRANFGTLGLRDGSI
jgi:hypothetical protein